MMKKLLLGLLLLLCGAAIGAIITSHMLESNPERVIGKASTTVIRRDISSSVLATGVIKPMVGAEVRVGSRISGMVKHLYVGIGDHVTEGQLLAELDADELGANLQKAEATLKMAQAERDFSKLDIRRKRSLAERRMIADDELDHAEKSHRLNQLNVEQAAANVNYVKTQLAYTRILAPISGVVATVTTQEGETVAASFTTPTFVTIIDLDKLEMWAYVDETDIGRVEEGQKTVFTIDTYPDTEFAGEVVSIHPNAVIQSTVVNYVVIIRIDDRLGRSLRPEMTTNVTIRLETHKNALAVLRQAVNRNRGRYVVYVREGDRIEEREVKVGWRDETHTEILSGLSEGETVLIQEP